jgi:hypothetical protein
MEHNQDTLSTRDLAAANDPVTEEVSDPARRDRQPAPEAPTEVYDREASEQAPALDEPGGTDSSARDIQSEPEGRVPTGEHGNASAESAPADVEPSRSPSGATQAGTSSAGVDVATSQAQSLPAPTSPASPDSATTANGAPLLPEELSTTFQRRWEEVQTRFVDEPRGAVEDADGLVANLMQQLAQGFAQERERLEAQWGRGEDISTEDLRVALQRYRSFFQRLLST